MEHRHPSATTPPAGIDPAAASLPSPCQDAPAAKPRECTADYRWTQPKVIAFLEALAACGRVGEAARAVGMSRSSAYRLRARMASARFDAAFDGARRTGIRARAAASRARLAAAARSRWEGPGIGAMVARERAREMPLAQGRSLPAQGDTAPLQGNIPISQGDTTPPQRDGFARKVTL